MHPEGRNALFDVAALNETTLGEAATAVNDALYAVQDSVMMTTSTSQYQYVLTEKANVFDTTAKALINTNVLVIVKPFVALPLTVEVYPFTGTSFTV